MDYRPCSNWLRRRNVVPMDSMTQLHLDIQEAVGEAVLERKGNIIEYEIVSKQDPSDSRYIRVTVQAITKEEFETEFPAPPKGADNGPIEN